MNTTFSRGLVAAAFATLVAVVAAVPASAAPAMTRGLATNATTYWGTYTVKKVIDGDTLTLTNGQTVRIIGLDAPEAGRCGAWAATENLRKKVQGKKVKIVNPASVNDKDKYGRVLRTVQINGADMGLSQIKSGYGNARYDSLDGFQWHPLQTQYRDADKATSHKCGSAADSTGTKTATKAPVAATSAEPWNKPGPDLDCIDIRKRVRVNSADYHGLDRDGDGWGCDSYA